MDLVHYALALAIVIGLVFAYFTQRERAQTRDARRRKFRPNWSSQRPAAERRRRRRLRFKR